MKLVKLVTNMANNKNHPLTAVWRDFTEEQIKALPPTREAAYEAGSMYYYSGKPCLNNHIAMKYRESRNCVICNSSTEKRKYYKNKPRSKKIKSKAITVMGINFNKLLSNNKE